MDIMLLCFCVLVLSLHSVCCQYSNSPCPSVFDYESDGTTVYGKIVLQPSASAHLTSLVVRINFTIATQLFTTYVGRIEAEDSNVLLQKYNSGAPVSYRVHFPVTTPLPKLTALTANGNIVCYGPGDIPRPNQYVTTLSLQHTSFLRGTGPAGGNPAVGTIVGGGPVYNIQPQTQTRPSSKPDPVLDLLGQFGDDAQIYTFNNIEPAWTTDNSPYYVLNNSHPFTQATQAYQPPTQSAYQPPIQVVFQKPKPAYEQETRKPVYEQPATRPQSTPNQQDSTYYANRVSEAPRPAVTQRPIILQPVLPTITTECGVIAGGNEKIPLIYNGKSYPRGELPWLVAIYKSDGGSLSFICGGTLVSNRHVVTAAHCMQRRSELTSIKDFVVKVGVHNLNDWSDDITVTRTLISAAIHESFNASTLENDILVFTFDKRVEFNTYIRPACLWNGNTELSRVVGASGVVAGWGDQGLGGVGKQGEPHMVRIPIVSTAACRASKPHFHKLTSAKTLCAGDRNGAGPCRGDSGGGLYLLDNGKWRLRGVVSVSLRAENGDNTCNLNEYIIFTDTAQYLTWIRSVISENFYD